MTSTGQMGIFKKCGPIAQREEPPAHNRKVPGSNPGGPTRLKIMRSMGTQESAKTYRLQPRKGEAGIKKCTPRGAFLFLGRERNCVNK